ncbi:MAG: preprotein translocase subunit SecA [Firmicutes bacterium ADurb.Bin300]|nr:MAG: preprotein translocase subunit SecA [Firmicutes bacterium ADurb.Bin300]
MSLLSRIFGDYSSKEIKRITPIKDKVIALEKEYAALSDAELQAKTPYFKERLSKGETLDDILPEAFAACREAAFRVLNMKHYPVQILGGIILHQGRIAEMKTGEGKTLVATLPAYLNALNGEGVHIVTVNDYLAKRDSEWMGKIYRFMGLSVGLIIHEKDNNERQTAYAADITFGTNNEMGFDYLRDNMVMYASQRVQRGHAFAIVDEVDSILVDEARTPLIISGVGEVSTELYKLADNFVRTLRLVKVKELDDKMNAEDVAQSDGDYLVDEKAGTATLTKSGIQKAEKYFNLENLMDAENMTIQHHINQALKAHGVMKRDIDYVVKDGEVLIVDEFTGRIMLGRRYNEGLHQAIEAKEKVTVARESRTLATITFQNFFRLYKKLSGMTGTAMTESQEFQEIYSLDVVEIPTNMPMIRKDENDVLYKTEAAKYNAIIDHIKRCNEKGQPVLVGTVNIEKNEKLSSLLKKSGIKHEILNAKFHEKEAEIIAQAGKFAAVTIATNMAGRGTDIILGGNPEYLAKSEMRRRGFEDELIAEATSYAETTDPQILDARKMYKELEISYRSETLKEAEAVKKAGGLCIIGTERHESRRIDNQLRGRAGRQGDPGESRFYLSAEDDLLRLFAGDRFYTTLDMFKSVGEMPIEARMFTSTIESAQKKVEGNNFAIRRNLLKYDDVMNKQREVIYGQRNKVLDGDDISETIKKMLGDTITESVDFYCPKSLKKDEWNKAGLANKYLWLIDKGQIEQLENSEELLDILLDKAFALYDERRGIFGAELMSELERKALLQNVDMRWMNHIDAMDELKRGISLRAYGQKDPVIAFREESFDMFDEMTNEIREGTVDFVLRARIRTEEDVRREQQAKITATSGSSDGTADKKAPIKKGQKIGRNEPCPCGSGKKYKHCCLAKDEAAGMQK